MDKCLFCGRLVGRVHSPKCRRADGYVRVGLPVTPDECGVGPLDSPSSSPSAAELRVALSALCDAWYGNREVPAYVAACQLLGRKP